MTQAERDAYAAEHARRLALASKVDIPGEAGYLKQREIMGDYLSPEPPEPSPWYFAGVNPNSIQGVLLFAVLFGASVLSAVSMAAVFLAGPYYMAGWLLNLVGANEWEGMRWILAFAGYIAEIWGLCFLNDRFKPVRWLMDRLKTPLDE